MSLSGAGLIWFLRDGGAEVAMGVSAWPDFSNQNSSNQFNGADHLGVVEDSLSLRGNSVAALTWSMTERPRGNDPLFGLYCAWQRRLYTSPVTIMFDVTDYRAGG